MPRQTRRKAHESPVKPSQNGGEPCEEQKLALDGALFVETFKRAW